MKINYSDDVVTLVDLFFTKHLQKISEKLLKEALKPSQKQPCVTLQLTSKQHVLQQTLIAADVINIMTVLRILNQALSLVPVSCWPLCK